MLQSTRQVLAQRVACLLRIAFGNAFDDLFVIFQDTLHLAFRRHVQAPQPVDVSTAAMYQASEVFLPCRLVELMVERLVGLDKTRLVIGFQKPRLQHQRRLQSRHQGRIRRQA